MTRRTPLIVTILALAGATCALAAPKDEPKPAAEPAAVKLWVFDSQVRAAAPGIEGVVTLTDAQKKKLQTVYNEVLGAETVTAAQKLLTDDSVSAAQRQEALETIQSARQWFLRRCQSEVFTKPQNELIKKVYDAYNDVRTAVLRDMAAKISEGFQAKLDGVLTPEQKTALDKAKADEAAAAAKP